MMSDQQLEQALIIPETDPAPENESVLGAQEQAPQQPPEEKPVQETAQAKNFRSLKEARERAERERDEALRRIKQLEVNSAQPVDEPDIEIDPTALAEGRHVTKLNRKMRQLEEKMHAYQEQTAALTTEARLKVRFADFDQIVSKDNLDLLSAAEPELAQTLNASPDLYSKAVTAYKMIKKLGIVPEDYQSDKERIQKNATKPRPVASISPQQGDGALSHANAFANGLTPELKKQLYKEMIESAKRA
jgi:hypothetical protein